MSDESNHGKDASDKPADGAKNADNPEIGKGTGEGEGGLGTQTGGQGGGEPTEPEGGGADSPDQPDGQSGH